MSLSHEINIPAVVAEVAVVFARYEAALQACDIPVMEELFCNHPATTRDGEALPGRETKTLPRTPQGWRIVSAHASLLGVTV